MIETAYAMGPPPGGAGQAGSPLMGLLPFILIFFVFYFLLIRPQKKQMQDQQKMINSLRKGDEIVTSGGMHGKVTSLKGKQLEVEIAAGTRITLNRTAVSQVKTPETAAADEKEEEKN
ncbi:MAG: preprotein translocase subunit YajC [Elusimicrobiota bacterium]